MRSFLSYVASASRDTDPKPWRTALFGKQRDYFDDPTKRKAALCTRRAGKTRANGALLVDAVQEMPEGIALYITLTSKTSRDNQEAELNKMNSRYQLGFQHSLSENRWYTKDGGYIWLAGCKDKSEAEKFRGPKYSRVIIDEGGTHRKEVLDFLVNDVLDPALTDLDGQMCLTGTPGEIPTGFFHDITTGKNPKVPKWSTHTWSVLDNPHHRYGRDPALLEANRIKRGLELDDPTWLREYCGLWVLDTRALIYRYSPALNAWDGVFPSGRRTSILGVDLGYDDETAFTVTTAVEGSPNIYVPHAAGRSGMLPAAMAEEIKRLRAEFDIDRVYVDSGGLGKTICEQLRQDYGLPVLAAEKTDKAGSIKRVQGALAAGRVKIGPGAQSLVDEWEVVAWDDFRKNHKEGIPDHKSDGFLYSFRQHSHVQDWEFEEPTVITPEQFSQQEMARLRSEALARSKPRRRR